MSNLSAFLSSTSPKALYAGQPGTNGYWRRDIFRLPGTHTWTAPKTGKIKIQAIGAASGAGGTMPGASGAFGEKMIDVSAGDTLTVVVGLGGTGAAGIVTSGNGGSTSISGTPIGGVPLTLVGATGINRDNPATGAAGTATGPWDLSYAGAKSAAVTSGSPSSASPFGPGNASTGAGGGGWGGPGAAGPASSHSPGSNAASLGLLSKPGTDAANPHGGSQPFWDFRDADGGATQQTGGFGGIGAAGTVRSVIGGGTNYNGSASQIKAGYGAGGGAVSSGTGGDGGDAFIMIFWDEVSLI